MQIANLARARYEIFCKQNPEFRGLTTAHDFDANDGNANLGVTIVQDEQITAQAVITKKSESTWGANAWLQFGNYKYVNQTALKALFTKVAQSEYDQGIDNFYIEVDAHDRETISTWFELGFGLQHISGILRNKTLHENSSRFVSRALTIEDLGQAALLEQELNLHQMKSPVFSKVEPQKSEEIVADWTEDLAKDEFVTRVIEVDKKIVGFAYGCSTQKSGLHSGLLRPPNSATLAFCAVLPQYRGQGMARSLTSAVINELLSRGFEHVVTDWRGTNQLSSRTWPALGFEPTIYRLHRAI